MEEHGWWAHWDSTAEVKKVVFLVCDCRVYHVVSDLQGWKRADRKQRGHSRAVVDTVYIKY